MPKGKGYKGGDMPGKVQSSTKVMNPMPAEKTNAKRRGVRRKG